METRASKKNLQEDNGRDRIHERSLNDFPIEILAHILKFLPTVDAVRTSLLSRKWRSQKLWCSLPFLDFIIPSDSIIYTNKMVVKRFVQFVDQTLKNRSGFPIQKFRFPLNFLLYDDNNHDIYQRIDSKLDDWISYAVFHMTTELDIELPYTCQYYFKFSLLNNSCVRDVRFYGGYLLHSFPSLNLDSIISVTLASIALTDDTILDLISSCNNLESLVLNSCWRMESLRIYSSTLKKLSLLEIKVSSLEIRCPNLCYLRISKIKMRKYCIKDSASLVEANINFTVLYDHELSDVLKGWSEVLRALTSVKKLTTETYWFELLCQKDASLDDCVFENLNHLELVTGYGHCNLLGMAALFKTCPNITTLTLDCYLYYHKHNGLVTRKLVDKPLEFDIPNLKILNLKISKGAEIDELLRLMKKHGTALEKIVLWEPKGKSSSIPLQGSLLNV